jgi:hypothetical protein
MSSNEMGIGSMAGKQVRMSSDKCIGRLQGTPRSTISITFNICKLTRLGTSLVLEWLDIARFTVLSF